MRRPIILLVVCLLLAACRRQDQRPLPTRIPDLTPSPMTESSSTPDHTLSPTWTVIPLTPPSLMPSETATLTLIQQTEVYLFGLRTAEAATTTAMAPTLPPTAEGGESESGLLPSENWISYEITLTTADLAQIGQQVGMSNVVVAFNGIFVNFAWHSGSDDYLLVIRQDALDGALIVTPISYQHNGTAVALTEAVDLLAQLRDLILSRRRPDGVSYLDTIQFGTDAYTLAFLQSPE